MEQKKQKINYRFNLLKLKSCKPLVLSNLKLKLKNN